ncbi:MAG: hypothetical protein KDB84_10505, partial [Flavobacteriales bacterium]|nr:hypothetical protein [Flavobacteriales bacterium]
GDDWGWYSAVVTGLTAPVVARVAIRYFVEYGGADGTNSSYVGFDALRISRGTTPVGELQGNAPRIRFDPITGAVQLMDTCWVAGTALVTDALGRQLGWIPVDREGTMDLSAYPGGIYRLFLFDRCERANHSVQIMKL